MELFFPVGTTGGAVEQLAEAKRICADCTVCDQCLQWATDTGVEHGVWGGLDEQERRATLSHPRHRTRPLVARARLSASRR